MISFTSVILLFLLQAAPLTAPATASSASQNVMLTAPAGAPLRLYLTKRIPKRAGVPVDARLIAPLYAFDREVLPAGTEVTGQVVAIEPVPKWIRLRAVLKGDFTPLHVAKVEFTSIVKADGSRMPLETVPNSGLNSLYIAPSGRKRPLEAAPQGTFQKGKKVLQDQLEIQLDKLRSIPAMVRGPDKTELFYEYALSKLPFHPQYVRNKTRFDAELAIPLQFGQAAMRSGSLDLLGSEPPPGNIAHARLLTRLSSKTSAPGERIEALLTEPLFSPDRKLILPEGTRVGGSVVYSKKAGLFHHGGKLRFNFDRVDLAPELAKLLPTRPTGFKTEAMLNAAESGKAPFKVDQEGGVSASESNLRFLNLAAAILISASASDTRADNDNGKGSKDNSNVAGRTLGGGLGFGLLGSIASQSTPQVGAALGYYGLAWSVYSNLVERGAEVEFGENAVLDITFTKRPPAGAQTAP